MLHIIQELCSRFPAKYVASNGGYRLTLADPGRMVIEEKQ